MSKPSTSKLKFQKAQTFVAHVSKACPLVICSACVLHGDCIQATVIQKYIYQYILHSVNSHLS